MANRLRTIESRLGARATLCDMNADCCMRCGRKAHEMLPANRLPRSAPAYEKLVKKSGVGKAGKTEMDAAGDVQGKTTAVAEGDVDKIANGEHLKAEPILFFDPRFIHLQY
jgi:hypothetical protein